ncbi:MAG: UDP-N-acetylglucosamine 2-epimerase, partial [Methanocella sp.]
RLSEIFKGIGMVSEESGMPVILPVHPRTRKMLATFNIDIPEGVRLIDPLGFMEFLKAESNARLVLTDSGGVQEECCILGVPCVTIRENTERPETVEVGANIIAGFAHEDIVKAAHTMIDSGKKWSNPFGDGFAGNRIIEISRARGGK